MAINFDSLPADKGNGTVENFENGIYRAKVEAADMKANKTAGKPDYLNIRLGVYSDNGTRIAGVFDIFTESEHPLQRYKLRRFLEACKLNLQGNFELKDLPKVVVNKELQVFLKVQHDEQYGDKIVVDVAPDEIYMALDEESAIGQSEEIPFKPDMTSEEETQY